MLHKKPTFSIFTFQKEFMDIGYLILDKAFLDKKWRVTYNLLPGRLNKKSKSLF